MKHRPMLLTFLAAAAGVVCTAQDRSSLTVSPASLTFNAVANGSAPSSQSLTVSAAKRTNFTASASTQSGGANWLSISPSGGLATNQTIRVAVNQAGLAAGTYRGTVSLATSRSTTTVTVTLNVSAATGGGATGSYRLLGWNDLGMHCMDGTDFSVWSVLPPANSIRAQLIDPSGKLVTSNLGIAVTYQAVTEPTWKTINSTSSGKTNFWPSFGNILYGAPTTPDVGLKGFKMPGSSNTPQALAFDATNGFFHADAIPVTPYPDGGTAPVYYPMMRLVAKNSTTGSVLAQTDITVPVSDEMDCKTCHGTSTSTPRQVKLNILQKHDGLNQGNTTYTSALSSLVSKGYDASGLYNTVVNKSRPVLCDDCHSSNALGLPGITGISSLSRAMHNRHSGVTDPVLGGLMGSGMTRETCYRCHPGKNTQCLRGAMGSAKDAGGNYIMQCQSCHDTMAKVADPNRTPWMSLPNCQACHTGTALSNNGQILYTNAIDSKTNTLRIAVNTTFATNPNTPSTGFSIYHLSKGHGNLQCEACHGAPHAEYTSAQANDNVQTTQAQGHAGMMAECGACHQSGVPSTVSGGPHGLHPIGQAWVSGHQGASKTGCQNCHGSDYRGTAISAALANRTLSAGEYGTKTFAKGTIIGCYSCHNGPNP